MRETVLLLDEPAEAAVASAAQFLRAQGMALLHQQRYSVSFGQGAGEGASPGETGRTGRVGGESAGEGYLAPGTGQIAAVPVQLNPEWCRLWVTVSGAGAAAGAAAAYVAQQQERSQRVEAAVRQLESGIYSEARWPAYEATLRANLMRQGIDSAEVDAKVAAFKKRWLALGRKASQAPPEGA